MFVVVVGGGKVGANVTRTLLASRHEVVLVEKDRRRFEALEEEFEHRGRPGRRNGDVRARAGGNRAAAGYRRRRHR